MAHIPVLLSEVLGILAPKDGERILDCTFGGGGHTCAILGKADCYVCAIDRDPEAGDRARAIKEKYNKRFDFVEAKFSEASILFANKQKFDAILFDFGISSFQVDTAERGFSFSKDAALDMRMSQDGVSAYDVVNTFPEEDLANIIKTYGDEPHYKKIAAAVVKMRSIAPIKTTTQLANIVRGEAKCASISKKYSKIDAATKTFQALRIFVNDELREISIALENLPKLLKNNARIAIISFHALEDRIVKDWAKSRRGSVVPINKSVIRPSHEEISLNPRSRSAILRGFCYNEPEVIRKASGDGVE